MDVGMSDPLALQAYTVSEVSFKRDPDDGQVCISNPGLGFLWLSAEDAVKLRDWLNANVRD